MKNKTWCMSFTIIFIGILLLVASATFIIDPFFHYHKPISFFNYTISNQRYQNDGIAKHFDYDALITGTSMTENFKSSEMDRLFDTSSVKIPFSGGSFKEMNDTQSRALKHNPGIRLMVRSLDLYNINRDKDAMREDLGEYPYYLYDNNPFNDVKYLLNKDVLLNSDRDVLIKSIKGIPTTTFDEYSNWMTSYTFGKESVDASYSRPERSTETVSIAEEDKLRIYDNITQNVTNLADEYPATQFYYFFPPYSIYYWDNQNQSGCLKKTIDEQMYATELMLEHPNIHVFGFLDEHELMCNLENYKDTTHYSETINSRILKWMRNSTHQLTKSNYQKYYEDAKVFLQNYDYDSLFQNEDSETTKQ